LVLKSSVSDVPYCSRVNFDGGGSNKNIIKLKEEKDVMYEEGTFGTGIEEEIVLKDP